ncbi:MAG: hypothetical protein RR413_04955 [Christensenellaceae bacterium]
MNKYDFITSKKAYREFCSTQGNDIQIFAQPWYLDAVCEDENDWQVILYYEENRLAAAFPFQYKKQSMGCGSLTIRGKQNDLEFGLTMDHLQKIMTVNFWKIEPRNTLLAIYHHMTCSRLALTPDTKIGGHFMSMDFSKPRTTHT